MTLLFKKLTISKQQEDANSPNPQMKEAMIYILYKLWDRVSKFAFVLQHIEQIVITFIQQEFNSNLPIIRNTVLLLYDKMFKIQFKVDGHFNSVLNNILNNLSNSHKGVSVQAAITLKN